jgi:ElaA protein
LEPLVKLCVEDLYDIMVLRQRVFVVEQDCAYLDCDGHDRRALHLLGRSGTDGSLNAYARLLAPGHKYDEASIGRVVVEPAARRLGLGHALMGEAVARARATFGVPLGIGAQMRLERFYGRFGFVRDGTPYSENGIPHIKMVLGL